MKQVLTETLKKFVRVLRREREGDRERSEQNQRGETRRDRGGKIGRERERERDL